MLVDVLLMLDELVLNHLLQVVPLSSQLRQAIDHVLHQMETVQFVLHPDVEGGRDRAFFLIAPDMKVAVGPAVGQAMDEPGIAVETEDDGFVLREERIVVGLAQPVWMFGLGLQLHQIDDVDYPDLKIGQMLA